MIPAGWIPNPNAPGWFYNPANPTQQQMQAPVAPAPAYAPMPGAVAPVAGAPYTPPAASLASFASYYQVPTAEAVARETERAAAASHGGGADDYIFIDFDDVKSAGQEAELLVRLLPGKAGIDPVTNRGFDPWCVARRHRVFADLLPNPPSGKQVVYIDCFESEGGPKNCPFEVLDAEIKMSGNEDAIRFAKNFYGRGRVYYQCLNLRDIQSHWVQEKDAVGNPVMDPATGQPKWKMIPGVIAVTPTIHSEVLALSRHIEGGNPFSPGANGMPIKFVKRKTGSDQLDVEYSQYSQAQTPMQENQLWVLHNLIDLREKLVYFRSREEMEAITDKIRSRFGLRRGLSGPSHAHSPPAGLPPGPPAHHHAPPPPVVAVASNLPALLPGWQRHPQSAEHAWNPTTGAMALLSQVLAPPPPAAPAYLPPPVAPGLPVAPPPPPAAPPPPPPYGAAPPGPPLPPPGMPPGVAPQLAPPPPPPGVAAPPPPPGAGAVMTPEQLEAALASGQVPF